MINEQLATPTNVSLIRTLLSWIGQFLLINYKSIKLPREYHYRSNPTHYTGPSTTHDTGTVSPAH